MEISLLCLINTQDEKAWTLDVSQTPAGLTNKQDDPDAPTRVDHYKDQLRKAQTQLRDVQYIVADGFYAKTRFLVR